MAMCMGWKPSIRTICSDVINEGVINELLENFLGGDNMMYAKSYIDKLFNTIDEYASKVELFRIAYAECQKCQNNLIEWISELSEIINWQAMSDRSGVWTYYEVLNIDSKQILIKNLKAKNESEILNKYSAGINNYDNEELMAEIDDWITKNETKIYNYIEETLITNREWFYKL